MGIVVYSRVTSLIVVTLRDYRGPLIVLPGRNLRIQRDEVRVTYQINSVRKEVIGKVERRDVETEGQEGETERRTGSKIEGGGSTTSVVPGT